MSMDWHAYWTANLAEGKSKHDRPINGSATKRVIAGPGTSITLRLHSTAVVVHHADGTATIRTGGWNTVTTRRFINEHTAARLWTEQGQMFLRVREPGTTPARVQKCRRCHGFGTQPQTCYGPSRCWGQFGGQPCQHGQTTSHMLDTCSHGQTGRHALEPVECWQCNGVGRCDYGSNPVHYAWDGDPLLIDADGFPIGPAPAAAPVSAKVPAHDSGGWNTSCDCDDTPAPPAPAPIPPAPTPSTSYSDSGQLLKAALPGLRTWVAYPCTCNERTPYLLESVIIHLNDTHGTDGDPADQWSRERIADWLDTLDVDLTFPVPDSIPAHIH